MYGIQMEVAHPSPPPKKKMSHMNTISGSRIEKPQTALQNTQLTKTSSIFTRAYDSE